MASSDESVMEFLPLEIVSHIFTFLPSIEDRKSASMVCRLWYEAYQSPTFRKDEVVVVSHNEAFELLADLTNANRVFNHVLARGVDINKNTKTFWDRYGQNIKTLSIHNCDFREKAFVNVIIRCDELESLCIQDCRELLMSGYLLESESERVMLHRKLLHLKSLNLGYNRYLSDAIFVRFTSICDNLQELLLPGCYVSFHSGLYRKFYKNGHSDPSESVLTFPIIYDFIREHASKLRVLSFAETLIDSEALNSIAQTKNLVLDKLFLRGCVQVTNDCIVTLTDFQLTLTHLDLALCPRITDLALLTICSRLTKLQSLSIQGCRAVTDLGISDVWRLTELTHLNISECELIQDTGILKALARRKNSKMQELYLSHLGDISDNAIVQLMEFLPNIRVLDLGYCYGAVTDKSVQAIFFHSKYLETLVLSMCDGLTDRGLTGIAVKVNTAMERGRRGRHIRIPLGSKAELKIVRDTKLKQDVREICENTPLATDLSGCSLSKLKYLRNLNLSGCSRISDVGLRYAFHLPHLRSLNLSSCQQVSTEGLLHVCENNKTIESLNLDNCQSVDDVSVGHIFKNLVRLKSLTLGSNNITDRFVENLERDQNTNLKFLDVRHCSQLSPLAVSQLSSYFPRVKIMHFSAKPHEFQPMLYHPPPPPPLANDS